MVENQAQLSNGELILKDPKSAAGRRAVAVPDDLLDELKQHLAKYAEAGEDGRVFVGPKGGKLRRQNFRKIWIKALADAKVREVHFHDLRHTGNQFAADEGATLRELMERMGHASSRAAMIYLHVSKGRYRQIADKLNARLRGCPAEDEVQSRWGTRRARNSPGGHRGRGSGEGPIHAQKRWWRRGDSNP